MTRTLVVLDHPYTYGSSKNEPHNRSFSAALCKSVIEKITARGEEADLIDLHAELVGRVEHVDYASLRHPVGLGDLVARTPACAKAQHELRLDLSRHASSLLPSRMCMTRGMVGQAEEGGAIGAKRR
ncbi:MAG: hypothetical protein IJO87_00190 [Eggerthellaceae bacterium]|nr:hypothetical protein [Eggerthellaceae bacterium]